MMLDIARTDRSIIGNWWWTVDRALLGGAVVLLLLGALIIFTASPPVARTLDLPEMHFIAKHFTFLPVAAALILFVSLLAPLGVLRLSVALLALFGMLLFLTPWSGIEIKGSHRWVSVFGFVLQPSEFVKPAVVVYTAYLLSRREAMKGFWTACMPSAFLVACLIAQPDLGMTAVVFAVFCVQLFVAGLPWLWVAGLGGFAFLGGWLAYLSFPHVGARIDSFLTPDVMSYQVEQALSAVTSGGLLGRGPGEGVAKFLLPDAHTDFVFAATAEEFGIAFCLVMTGLFAFLVLRGLSRINDTRDRFITIAATGLLSQFGMQALINMMVNLNLVPTKGMTLPFISYGGSSLIGIAIGMGMILALTRRGARLEIPR